MASITKRGDSWFVQIRRKGFKPRFKSFVSHSSAVQWARIEEATIDNGHGRDQDTNTSNLTVKELLARYSSQVSSKKKGVESEQLRLAKMQLAPFSLFKATNLTPAAVASYRDDRLLQVKPSTVRRELGILRSAIETARLEWGVPIRENPVACVSLPTANDARERRVSEDELQSIWRALEKGRNPVIKPIAMLAIATGLRRGELLKLRWNDIDFRNRTAKIRDTKNGSDRTIPLSNIAVNIINELDKSDGAVFLITPNALRQGWSRACSRGQVTNLRFHDLRHEAISRFFELGLSVPEVALISGHKDVRMLFRYTHLVPQQVNDRIDELTETRAQKLYLSH